MQNISEQFAQDFRQSINYLQNTLNQLKDLANRQQQEWVKQFTQQTLEAMLQSDYQYLHDDYIEFISQYSSPHINIAPTQVNLNDITLFSTYDQVLKKFKWQSAYPEKIILSLALLPILAPEILIEIIHSEQATQALGFLKTSNNQYVPTEHTVLQVLKANQLGNYQTIQHIFSRQHPFASQGILSLSKVKEGEPPLSGQLLLSPQYLHLFTTGQAFQPQFAADFPATLLTTDKNWDDLILRPLVQRQVDRAKQWVTHYEEVKTTLGGGAMKGYRLMMMGPPGTGKTLTAQLLAKHAQKPLYRINIDRIVDKYVGETNKKLEQVFQQAAHQDWILFFDEGDALFGKRSSGGSSSNERYANQEVNYLLTKMEEYEGMIFLSTNQGGALDDAFKRRFDTRIMFREPDESTRTQLWEHFFSKGGLKLSAGISLREFASQYDYNAAWIEKFHRYCVLQTIAKGDEYIAPDELLVYMEQFEEK